MPIGDADGNVGADISEDSLLSPAELLFQLIF